MINKLEGKRFVLCIDNRGNEASLEKWKMYRCIPDDEAEKHGEIRVIDEEGEDYLYPAEIFSDVSIDPAIAKKFVMEQPDNEKTY